MTRSLVVVLSLSSLLAGCGDGSDPSSLASTSAGGAAGSVGDAGGASGAAGSQGGAAGDGGASGSQPAAGQGGGAGAAGQPQAAFASQVVSFEPGKGAGYGQESMPGVVLGPPVAAASDAQGGTDVVSLGVGGTITLQFGSDVVDGPGVDFLVFENPFVVGGNPDNLWKELGEVSVSVDGATWVTFPCVPEQLASSHCAGWHVVKSSPTNGIPPDDPEQAGGDPFDLAVVGLARARFVRIHDLATAPPGPPTAGFDLDAVAVVHAAP